MACTDRQAKLGERMAPELGARPLGVRADFELTAEQERVLQALEHYDWAPVVTRLVRDGVMPAAWVADAVVEFRRYLALRVLYPEQHLQMFSKHVDVVWHTCLLFSRQYAEYCQRAFGQFVHHEPSVEPLSAARIEEEWEAFQTCYERGFGPLPRLWQMARPRQDNLYVD